MLLKLKELPELLTTNYLAGVNTFVLGKPAIGKTKVIEKFAADMKIREPKFKLWQFYAPSMSPMDIQASAPNYETGMLAFYNNAALPNHYKDPSEIGILFLGEMPNADTSTIKLLQKYVNGEDMSGVLKKPEGIIVVADGNRLEDRSGAQVQGRALVSRFEQLEVFSEAEDNIEFAIDNDWHPYVQIFFKENPQLIDNYEEAFGPSEAKTLSQTKICGKRGIWANMRSWERVSKKEYISEKQGRKLTTCEVAGNVGEAIAAQYEKQKKIISNLASFSEVMRDPSGVKIPGSISEVYTLAMIVALRCESSQIALVKEFGERLPVELQIAILRNLAARKNMSLQKNPSYMAWMKTPEIVEILRD